jgi:predicted amidophosphoribosyltransferase
MSRLISVVCPGCGSHDIQEDLVCQSCGSRLAWSHDVQSLRLAGINHQCPGCGRLNDKANRFCAGCAAPLVLACPVCNGEHPQDTLACPTYGVKLLRFREAVAVLARAAEALSQARQEIERFEEGQTMQKEIADLSGPQEFPIGDVFCTGLVAVPFCLVAWIVCWLCGWIVMVVVFLPFPDFFTGISDRTFHAIPRYFGHLGAVLVFLVSLSAAVEQHRADLKKKKDRLAELRLAASQNKARPDAASRHLQLTQDIERLVGTCARDFPEPVVAQMRKRAGL